MEMICPNTIKLKSLGDGLKLLCMIEHLSVIYILATRLMIRMMTALREMVKASADIYSPHPLALTRQTHQAFRCSHRHSRQYVPAFQYPLLWRLTPQSSWAYQWRPRSNAAPHSDGYLRKAHNIVIHIISKNRRHDDCKSCAMSTIV